jgi:uncharacterized protein
MSDMNFEWDETKAASNLAKHDLSFASATECFDFPGANIEDARADYGETRINRYGRLSDGKPVVVTFTRREFTIRIISARPANSKEKPLIP